jgi:succinate-semialdehyde dehydrogenase/glutarate-semialdehyde dehydrogenase
MGEAAERRVLDAVPDGLLIDGAWGPAKGHREFGVEDPATREQLRTVADATEADVVEALDAAAAAQAGWAATAPRERAEILRSAFETMTRRSDDLALLMTLEHGKPVAESKAEVTYAAEFFRWFSEETARISGTFSTSPAGNLRVLTVKQPVGPCLLITPWNFPLAMGTRKIGPAIAAGCTMVMKPAKQTPLSMLMLGQILQDAGLPNGVLNIVTATDPAVVSEPLLRDPRLRKLSFTGSTGVGRKLLELSAGQVLRTSMELGGNAPFLVFADADVEKAVEGAMIAKMRNMGQACTSANRFLVHSAVADEFTERLVESMGALVPGRGTEPGITLGPLIDQAAVDKVDGLVADATGRGAKLLLGGKAGSGSGYFYEPTVLTDIPAGARLLAEEIFGPVAAIRSFDDDEQAIAAANDTEFGLVAYAFTADLDRALRVAEALESGMVGINVGLVSNPAAPFGGVKHSGLGREGGAVGIEEYLETKYVAFPG